MSDLSPEERAAKRCKTSEAEPPPPQQLFAPVTLTKYTSFYRSYNPPRKKTKNIPPEIISTRRSIQHCCRDNDLSKGLGVIKAAIEECVYLEAQSFYNLLNLCEGSFSARVVHVGTPRPRDDVVVNEAETSADGAATSVEVVKEMSNNTVEDTGQVEQQLTQEEISLSDRLAYANTIHSLLSQLNIPCTEPTYTALIRLASRVGDFDRAKSYLNEAEATQQCKVKLRMYSALLRGYCGDYFHEIHDNDGDIMRQKVTQEKLINALKVWIRMYNHSGTSNDPNLFGEGISPKIQLSEIEYASLIKAATCLRDGAVMERMLSDLAEKVLVPGLETTESVLDWFRSDVGGSHEDSALKQVELPPPEGVSIGDVQCDNGKGWRVYKGCTIDSNTGQLTLGAQEGPKTDCNNNDAQEIFKLKPVELSDSAWATMRRMNIKIVLEGQVEGHMSKYQGGGKGKKMPRSINGNNATPNNNKSQNNNNNKRGEWRTNAWKQFESFIENHPPYSIVIDGANVGYFQQNFSNAPKHVDYNQIDWLLRHLLEHSNGKHIILFLHERHFSPKLCPPWALKIINAWDGNLAPYEKLTVYRTPFGMNDDWYWMHAALMSGTNSKPILAVTNDEMRDHHFQMLAQGSFLRWKERHQVHFDFGSFDRQLDRREVLLEYPSAYSRRIQRVKGSFGTDAIAIPLPKKGDEGRYVDGYHVADESAPEEETYVLVVRANE
ncbi:hypothetical protein ACHAWO_012797 [Cyclotella atomus]|uniref:Mitochondrial ribonuclease P catalytic subunit n=1 Tax=Cyclotella atomus TaxID=382360 RepID=A0ABD3NXH3_9STRA